MGSLKEREGEIAVLARKLVCMHRTAWLVFAAALALHAWDANDELLTAARSGNLAAVRAQLEKGAVLETKTPTVKHRSIWPP